jgi:hypothetical protein
MDPFSSLFSFGVDAVRLGFESYAVIGLRLARFASGSISAAEWSLMVEEKVAVFIQAQGAAATAMAAGRPDVAAARALRTYRRRVSANRRRLGG